MPKTRAQKRRPPSPSWQIRETFFLRQAGAFHFAIVATMSFQKEKIGIVLMNTGSPDSPEPHDIRPYLIEFLSDRNLIKVPPVIWQPILRLFIARTRPKKTSPRYQQIWTPEGSPLLVESLAQRDALNERLSQAGISAQCEVGMRYGNPSVHQALDSLEAAGCKTVIALPLFPQTAFSTVKTCREYAEQCLAQHPALSLVSVVKGYCENPLYTQALAACVQDAWEYQPGSKLLFCFHSIPLADIDAGDTYVTQIEQGMQRVTQLLGIPEEDWSIAYHSRFEDSRAWVAPHPKTTLAKWADEGVGRIALMTPGFASDCLESLYDIKHVTCDYFKTLCTQHGRRADVTYIPCLNHRSDHIDLLFDVVKEAIEKQ